MAREHILIASSSGHLDSTQGVADVVTLSLFSGRHWHLKSVMPQPTLTEAVARQVRAQEGICGTRSETLVAVTEAAKAVMAKVENLMVAVGAAFVRAKLETSDCSEGAEVRWVECQSQEVDSVIWGPEKWIGGPGRSWQLGGLEYYVGSGA